MGVQNIPLGITNEVIFIDNNTTVYPSSIKLNNTQIWEKENFLEFVVEDNGNIDNFQIKFSKKWDGTLYYKLSDMNGWGTITSNQVITLGRVSSEDAGYLSLKLKGEGNTGLSASGTISSPPWTLLNVNGSPKLTVIGSLDALLDSRRSNISTIRQKTFRGLFKNWTVLYSVIFKTYFPTDLPSQAFYEMFYGCSNLRSVTQEYFNATGYGLSCFYRAFYNCSALENFPTLFKEFTGTIGNGCMDQMYYGCVSPTSAIANGILPNQNIALANVCYRDMFRNCSNLSAAPSLPWTTLATGCYESMFQGCSNLSSAPSLPATNTASHCYRNMFKDCSNLETMPSFVSTEAMDEQYVGMFENCSKIKISETQDSTYINAFQIPTNTIYADPTTDMFSGTGGSFTGTPSTNTTYYTANTFI